MNGNKCTECGLLNLDSDRACRRCGRGLSGSSFAATRVVSPRDSAKQSTWLYTLLFITLIGGGAYYLYTGFMKSFEHVRTTDPMTAKPAANQPQPPLTRSESDQKRITPFKNAIQNSSGLSQAANHTSDMQKLMSPDR